MKKRRRNYPREVPMRGGHAYLVVRPTKLLEEIREKLQMMQRSPEGPEPTPAEAAAWLRARESYRITS